jgi:acyl-CoA synthetase (AMP-forming)/AMP-acid ligase II
MKNCRRKSRRLLSAKGTASADAFQKDHRNASSFKFQTTFGKYFPQPFNLETEVGMASFSPNIISNSFISCATYNPDGEFVVYGNRRITWKNFVPRVFRVADALIRLGVKKDEKVTFMFHNTPEFMEVNFGIQVAGAVPCPMNYRFVENEIQYQGNHCDAAAFIFDDIWADSILPAMKNLKNIRHFISRGDLHPERTSKKISEKIIDYEDFVGSGEEKDPGVKNNWEDVAVMIYTGGTTGFPKGVMLTYQSHLDMFSMLGAHVAVRTLTADLPRERFDQVLEDSSLPLKGILKPFYRSQMFKNFMKKPSTLNFFQDKIRQSIMDPKKLKAGYKNARKAMYPSMPLFHDAAYANLMMGALVGALSYVLPESLKFDPALILQTIEKEKVYQLANVPTGWKKLLSYPDFGKYDVSSVKTVATGGGACPKDLKQNILRAFPGAMILDVFGQTEMTPATSFKIDFDPDQVKDRSVGSSIVETKVIDENGNKVAQGMVGEICYKSSTVMKGYYKDDEKTREVMADGWFKSGDLGYIDETGEIRVVDRKKECINTGGEKVFPLEVEEIIATHPAVDTVCIIGVPDEEWGHQVRAVIALKNGAQATPEDIISFCRGKLAGYKIPKSVIFTEDIPFSPAGKMLRQKVRESYGQ